MHFIPIHHHHSVSLGVNSPASLPNFSRTPATGPEEWSEQPSSQALHVHLPHMLAEFNRSSIKESSSDRADPHSH